MPRTGRLIGFVLAALGVVTFLASCGVNGTVPASVDAISFSPVVLLGTEQLELPAVNANLTFKLPDLRPIDPNEGASGQAAGFFVTLAVDVPERLKVRLVDRSSGSAVSFTLVQPPTTEAERRSAAGPDAFDATVRDELRAGRGVLWPADQGDGSTPSGRRFALMIPAQALSPFMRLDLYTGQADDGTPLGAARIDLVDDFFYLVVLGDSVQWGNGLREADKISTLVANVIEQQTGRKVILQRYAQSGAQIAPHPEDGICDVNCFGEVPTVRTSVHAQVERIERPELIDLVLMNGCINDVGLDVILDPLGSESELVESTAQACGEGMTGLLEKIHLVAPQAAMVVMGYYPIVGPESDLLGLRAWLLARDIEGVEEGDPLDEGPDAVTEEGTVPDGSTPPAADGESAEPDSGDDPIVELDELVGVLSARSTAFVETANQSLRAAVDSFNVSNAGSAMAAFADPGFGPDNAVFAPNRWLWSMASENRLLADIELDLALLPEDPLAGRRASICADSDVIYDLVICLYVSVGHPNPIGARAYADAIVTELRTLEVLPAPAMDQ